MQPEPSPQPTKDAWFFGLFVLWIFLREVVGNDNWVWRMLAAILAVSAALRVLRLIRDQRRWRQWQQSTRGATADPNAPESR